MTDATLQTSTHTLMAQELVGRARNVATFTIDGAGAIAAWSASAERLFGYAASDVAGRSIAELAPFVSEGDLEADGWCRRANGTRFRGQLAIADAPNSDGKFIVTARDVQVRYEAEELSRQVRERQERVTAAIARLVVFSIDIMRGEVDVSDGLAELIGWTRGRPPRQLADLLALVHHIDRIELQRQLEQTIATQGAFDFEFRVYADLGERWLHVRGSFIGGPAPRIVGTGMDATERRRVEGELRASRATLRAVLDATIDGILTIDDEGYIASANRTAAQMFRVSIDELIGAPWATVLDVRSNVLPPSGTLHDVAGRRSDGAAFPVEAGFTEVEIASRRLIICVLRDITERRLLERQVLDVSEQLQRQIGQDLHDGLGQLLTGTAFLAKGLENNVAEPYQPQAQRVVELVNQAIGRVRNLARGLSPIHVEAQSLEAVMRHVVAESSKLLGVECILEPRDVVEAARPATMVQLCLIAREAITNAVRHGQARRIVVRLERDGEQSLLSIQDDGTGIEYTDDPPEGLGLRSMRYRAKMIGGTLEVVRCNVGTVVRCWWSEA